MLIEFSDSDAEVSEVDASEIISVSDASDEAVESAVLVASEAGVVIESDATAP